MPTRTGACDTRPSRSGLSSFTGSHSHKPPSAVPNPTRPSGPNATAITVPKFGSPLRDTGHESASVSPVARSRIATVVGFMPYPPTATRLPSSEIANALMPPRCSRHARQRSV